MAVGTVVVGTDAGGIPEVVRHGLTGWVVPQRDPRALAGAMRSVLESTDRREAMVREARRTIERDFDGRVTARRFLAGIGLADAAGVGGAR
jgi:glycosyltransferase involved in cell wall biosynthesis